MYAGRALTRPIYFFRRQMEILKHLPDEAPERIMESVKNLEMKVLEECKGNAHDYVNIIGKKMKLCISRIYANKNKVIRNPRSVSYSAPS